MAMQFLTASECGQWSTAHGWPWSGRPAVHDLDNRSWARLEFAIPSDAGRRVALLRMLWRATGGSPRLLWVTDWSVWPSGEHLPLYSLLRERLGDRRALHEAPGHLTATDEDEDSGLAVATVAVLFLWDLYVLGEGRGFFLSQDEYGTFFTDKPESAAEVRQGLASFADPAACKASQEN